MDHQTQVSLSRKIFSLIDERGTSMAGSVYLNPVSSYTSVQQLEREQRLLFRARPLLMGLSCRLVHPGDYLTDDLSGVPILIVRTAEGRLNAFINVCRHRGAKLLEGTGRLASSLSCPYHGWTYDLHGKLAQLAPSGGFDGLDRAERNLVALSVVERNGLIWVHPTPGMTINIDAQLGALNDELAGYDFQHFAHYETRLLHRSINWKIVIDTFLENWHFPFVHRATVLPIFLPSISHFKALGLNARLIMPRRSILQMRDSPEGRWNLLKHSLVIYLLFPNTLLLWQGDHLEIWRAFPSRSGAVDQCVAEVSLYTPRAATTERERKYWDKNMELLMKTVGDEDFRLSEHLQMGFTSGAQEYLTFGKNEPALQHFHQAIQAALALVCESLIACRLL